MEEETTHQDPVNQEPSVWDRVDALSKKPESVWDQVDAVQQDPRAKQIDWTLQQAASKDPERAANVVRLTNRYKLPEPFVEKNYERLADEEKKGNLASKDLVNKNPILADAITQSPNYTAAAIKHLPALKQLELLYTRPPALLPQDEKAVQAQARNIAHLKAEQDWKAGKTTPRGYATQIQDAASTEAGIVPQGYSSQQEMEDDYYKEELARRTDIEKLMGNTGAMGFAEKMAARFPGDEGHGEAFYSHLPFFRFGPAIHSALEMGDAKRAVEAGTADEIQKDAVKQAQRLAAIQKVRGTGFGPGLGEMALGFPAMAGEFMVGFGLGKAFTAGMGKLASFFLEPAVGAATAGLPEAAQTFIQNKGEGDSTPEALAKSARDAYATYLGAGIFGPWFAKATPEAQALIKESLLKTIPLEALKMPAMNAATEILKAVGPDFAEHLKQTEVFKATQGDPEAIKSIIQQSIVGGVAGAAHGVSKGIGITAEAQAYADASLKRHELLHTEMSKGAPELAQDISKKLADAGPNKYTRIPVASFIEHYGDEARTKAGEMLGDPEKFDHAKKSGADLIVSTAVYDHTIGADPAASKFFANEIRPEADAANLREAQALEKAYNAGVRIPARDRIVQQIVEDAKGSKVKEAVGMADLATGGDNLLNDPATLGLNDDQVSKLSAALAKARGEAEATLNAKEQDRRDKLKGALYEKEKARTTEAVTKEVDQRQEQLALARLQAHQLPDGTPLPPDVPKIKLSREALAAEGYQESSIPKGVVGPGYIEGTHPDASGVGIHHDEAASMLGFKSGHDLLLALAGLHGKAREEAIKYEVDSQMAQKFPLGLQPSELPEEAMKALHNKYSAKLAHMTLEAIETNKLKQMVGVALRKVPKLADVTADAERDIQGQQFATLNPNDYLAAERQAKKDAMEAVFSGKWEDVFDAKLRELHAHERYRIAQEVVEDSAKTIGKFQSLPDAPYLNNARTGGFEWGQHVKNFLRKFGIVAVDPNDLATMKPWDTFAKEKFDSGDTRMESLYVDPRFAKDDFTMAPRDMTYNDLQSLKETVDQLTHLAREIDKVGREANRVAIDAWERDFTASVAENFKKRPPLKLTDSGESPLEKALGFARKVDASLDRPESFFDRLDGNKIDGPVNKYLWQPQVEARVRYAELKRQFSEALQKIHNEMPKEIARRIDEKLQIEGLKVPITRGEGMAIIANGGNESNFSKMKRGEEIRNIGLTEAKIQEIGHLLTEAEKDHIQKRLDVTNMFWPEIEKLHIWATGKPPKKIVAKQMIEAMGDRAGGYYPAMYDSRYSKVVELQMSGELGQLLEKSYRSSTTDAGYRQERIEAFAAPMDYNFSRLATHVDSMVKDIAFRPWLMDANKLVSTMGDTLRDYVGPEYRNFAREWMKRVIGADNHPSGGSQSIFNRAMSAMRHNVTMATLALKPAVFLHHALGIGPAITEVGPQYFMKGYGEFLSAPMDSYKRVIAESPEMAHYLETFDANIRSSLARLEGKTSTFAEVQRLGMKIIPIGNMLRAMPTYLGAKAKAMAELSAKGHTGAALEKLAIQSAEKAVRKTSGSGNPGDVPAIMKSEGMKMLLMFYTPGSIQYSQYKTAIHEFGKSGNVGKFLTAGFVVPLMTAALHTLVSGRLPDEDKDETWAGMMAKDMATYPFSAIPMGHDIARGVVDAAEGKNPSELTISSPAYGAINHTFETISKTSKWFQDEAEFEDVARSMFKTSGYWFGAPTEQVELSGGYMADLMRGKSDPNDLWEFMHDLAFRKPKSRR